MKIVWCALFLGLAAAYTALAVRELNPESWAPALTVGVLVFSGLGALLGLFGLREPRRSAPLWAVRGSMAFLMTFAAASFYGERWQHGVVASLLLAGGLVLHQAAYRYRLGWMVDGRGERQKVTAMVGSQAIYTPTSWSERIVEQAEISSKRRRTLLWTTPVLALVAALIWYLHERKLWLPEILVAAAALTVPLRWLVAAWQEVLFLAGYQDMKGARVLDPEPKRPGIIDVEGQKVHGHVELATEAEANRALCAKSAPPFADPSPLYLGRHAGTEAVGGPLHYDGDQHLVLFGPTGSGKSKRLLIPNLLMLERRSLVVIDPKGELARETADFRRTVGDVVILNPFGAHNLPSDGFNPLINLDPESDKFVDDAMGLGEALVVIPPGEHDPHWSEKARNLLVGLIMWEVKEARRETRAPLLENVRAMLTEPEVTEADGRVRGLRRRAAMAVERGGFEIASLLGGFVGKQREEIAGIQSTADRHTAWLLSRSMRTDLVRDGIDFRTLKKQPTSVYVILPAEYLETHSAWFRMVVVSALRSLFTMGGVPTLFMLDEFAQLGRLKPIEAALGIAREYGVQLWPVFQDIGQLKDLYDKRADTFIGNAGIVQTFGPNDDTMAEWISKRIGETTVVAKGYNQGDSSGSRGPSTSDGLSFGQIKRRKLLPQEVKQTPNGHGFLWCSGTSTTIPFSAPFHWEISELQPKR
jgi:type IV secretion system protein VirD4